MSLSRVLRCFRGADDLVFISELDYPPEVIAQRLRDQAEPLSRQADRIRLKVAATRLEALARRSAR